MAPPPEYDKEPKAPDKSATNIPCEETKALHNLVNDQQANSDNKSSSAAASADVENNKLVETLDDGQLRALLDEAITYKCPKDREGKSSLFKELLEEVEQDEQASEAAAREGLSGTRSGAGVSRAGCSVPLGGRGSRSRRALPHSNSLQDLVAALAAEPAPRRHHRAHPAPAPAPVSTRAIHGGSLPSGVDTSFLLGEEPTRGAGYLATVRCVNPPPLGERRVSATDANCLAEVDSLNRRSKPAFPMTYTARATLEIGSGSVCSGRAVTTTTASNQVRTSRPHHHHHRHHRPARTTYCPRPRAPFPTAGPPERLYSHRQRLYIPGRYITKNETFQSYKANPKNDRSERKIVKTDERYEFAKYYEAFGMVDEPKDKNENKETKKDDEIMNGKINENETEPERFIDDNLDNRQIKLLSALFKYDNLDYKQNKLLSALCDNNNGGGSKANIEKSDTLDKNMDKFNIPRGPQHDMEKKQEKEEEKLKSKEGKQKDAKYPTEKTGTRQKELKLSAGEKLEDDPKLNTDSDIWINTVNTWYEQTDNFSINLYDHESNHYYQSLFKDEIQKQYEQEELSHKRYVPDKTRITDTYQNQEKYFPNIYSNIQNMTSGEEIFNWSELCDNPNAPTMINPVYNKRVKKKNNIGNKKHTMDGFKPRATNLKDELFYGESDNHMQTVEVVPPINQHYNDPYDYFDYQYQSRQKIREQFGRIAPPKLIEHNPKNVRRMTIGKPTDLSEFANVCVIDEHEQNYEKQVLNESVLSKSNDPNILKEMKEEHDIGDIGIADSVNLSARSSTPIPEQSIEVEIEKTEVVTGAKETESSDNHINLGEEKIVISFEENSSKTDDFIEESKLDKGTVTVSCQPDKVNNNILDNLLNDLCSSQERDQSCDMEFVNPPSQEEEKNIELFDVRPIDKSDASFDDENDVELVDMSSHSCEMKDILNKNNELAEISDFIKTSKDISFSIRKNEEERHKIKNSENMLDTDEELLEMSSNRHDIKHVCQEDTEAASNTNVILYNREDKSFSNYLAVQRKLLHTLEASNLVNSSQVYLVNSSFNCSEKVHNSIKENSECTSGNQEKRDEESHGNWHKEPNDSREYSTLKDSDPKDLSETVETLNSDNYYIELTKQSNKLKLTLPPNDILEESKPKEKKDTESEKLYIPIQKGKSKKKKESALEQTKLEAANKKVLKAVMFDSFKNVTGTKLSSSQSSACKEVDSAIPFSCITTPEVVASCNTTSSTSQSAVSVDPKPRSVIPSSFNGLPLTRPSYGATGITTQEEYKKSIDENGNSVQGFSSPLSGSSQHKKPRRKKSSKNETVIKSHQIDGYQGNKDLNEVLRFIESAADTNRAGKLQRAKHRDDADDKGGKKRSGARKDKESKMKRATSMEELSRTTLEDLTDKPSAPARTPRHTDQGKAERRSWGDDARSAATRFFREEPSDALSPAHDSDFQTVTKKRKPRRRADEPAGGDPPRTARAPSPRARRVSAPPSDRSNDSNDDMDSVHSLPADAVVARPAAVSYADIARTRHNIPDLIESCNFYSEGERDRVEKERCVAPIEVPAPCAAPPGDVDGYPALEPRARRLPASKPPPTLATLARRERKVERTDSVRNNGGSVAGVTNVGAGVTSVGVGVAPDVVSDRRPAVILLDSSDCRDMDGVTFGFDINHTLLGGPTRRPRCDLVRDAIEGATLPPESNGEVSPARASETGDEAEPCEREGGVAVGCLALRYLPPAPPPDSLHLHQIIDYVAAAWEDVVRCGAGKVRYYAE